MNVIKFELDSNRFIGPAIFPLSEKSLLWHKSFGIMTLIAWFSLISTFTTFSRSWNSCFKTISQRRGLEQTSKLSGTKTSTRKLEMGNF